MAAILPAERRHSPEHTTHHIFALLFEKGISGTLRHICTIEAFSVLSAARKQGTS